MIALSWKYFKELSCTSDIRTNLELKKTGKS